MHTLRLVGQVISVVNYTTRRIFDFNPEPLERAARCFLACGTTELEVPQNVLDPNGKFSETGLDEEAVRETLSRLPPETCVIGTYLSAHELGADNSAYVKRQKRALSHFIDQFPDAVYAMLHPAPKEFDGRDNIRGIVDAYAEVAEHGNSLRPGFQLCFHNHFDSNGESESQVRAYLEAIQEIGSPALNWGIDTAHSHGMGGEYLAVLNEYAHLIGDFIHFKARIPAFDELHGGEEYQSDRDIWSNPAEIGKGLYSGFVNVADPEVQTPFREVFQIIREKARPTEGLIRGALEIDVPRQHPQLEVLCATLYLRHVHGVETNVPLTNDELISSVFAGAA